MISNASKALGAFLTGFAAWLTQVTVSDSHDITSGEWVALAGLAITVITVYVLKNVPDPADPR